MAGRYFFIFTTALIVLSANEFYSLARKKNIEPSSFMGITFAAALNAAVYLSPEMTIGLNNVFDFLIVMVAFVLLSELSKKRTDNVHGAFENASATLRE